MSEMHPTQTYLLNSKVVHFLYFKISHLRLNKSLTTTELLSVQHDKGYGYSAYKFKYSKIVDILIPLVSKNIYRKTGTQKWAEVLAPDTPSLASTNTVKLLF